MGLTANFDDPQWVDENAQQWCFENPDASQCEYVPTNYDYDISMAANVVFCVLFSLSLIGFVATYAIIRRGAAFTVALILGLILEILGYAGRIMGAINAWDGNGFLLQICCLTIGPAFLAAAIYFCLRRIVAVFGPENSRIRPEYYTRIFIPCDILGLVFQALGGALASIASNNNESVDLGSNIMIAGLAMQVATVFGFIIVSSDFALRLLRRRRALGPSVFPQEPELVRMRSSLRFKGFLGALSLATVCIFWRSVFRVAELSGGWDGELMGRQDLFIAFEGVLIIVAVLALNVFHPAFCSKQLLEGGGGLSGVWGFRRRNKGAPAGATTATATRESKNLPGASSSTSFNA